MGQIDLMAVAALLDQEESRVREFKRETYSGSFEAYMEENRNLWDSFRELFAQEEESAQTEEAVAECLVYKAQGILDAQPDRISREKKQLDMNLYMVSYVFPALLTCQAYPKKDGNASKMADAVCRKWKDAFPKYVISYADYDTIQNGFKRKLCYITTAVCQGLHQQQDCREIMLMKQYRDDYLIRQSGGEAVIKEYYDIAPTIVKRIEKEAAPEEKYQYLWEHYLQFCVAMVEAGRYEECREKYEQMVKELRMQYLVTNHHDI